MRLRTCVPIALAATALGCARAAPPISDEQFIDAVVALRRNAYETSDTAGFATRRDSVLRELGLSEAELEAYVRFRLREPARLAAAWDSANARLRAGPRADTAAE